MPKIEIMINGKEYPCRQTMGAMLRFKKETGKEVTELGNSLSDMCAYLFCCVASACKHDGVKFDMSLMDFADSLTPEDMAEWNAAIMEAAPADEDADSDEKKSR